MARGRPWVMLAAWLPTCWLSAALHADVFLLTNGGSIEGELLNAAESPRQSYIIQTEHGGKLALSSASVREVVVKPAALRQYEADAAAMADTAADHWAMAQRCQQHRLNDQYLFHAEQVLRHDPDHEPARHALGYSRVEGKWRRQDDWLTGQGYVRRGGRWVLPQEIALESVRDTREDGEVEWRKQIRMWRTWLTRERSRAVQAETNFRAIDDPQAIAPVVELLKKKDEPRLLKVLYVEVLGKLLAGGAEMPLAETALLDRDPVVRDRALDFLAAAPARAAVERFTQALRDDDNVLVLRGAVALGRLKDPAATRPLIDALVTEHKRQVGGGPGINPTFSSDGGSGLNMGGKPTIVKVPTKNEPVLAALAAIHPGVNFGFDEERWRAWYVEQNVPRNVNLRRSE